MNKQQVVMAKVKETKNMVKYEVPEGNEEAPCRDIYVYKGTFPTMPTAIKVTVEAA